MIELIQHKFSEQNSTSLQKIVRTYNLQNLFFQIKENLIMKKAKIISGHPQIPSPDKITENLLKKKPNKSFEFFYRERDQSVDQNPIESIIFVKSKPCKTASYDRKIKVQQQFNKIMNDLNAHINQHKKTKSYKKYLSTTSSQPKTTLSTKKSLNKIQSVLKKNKTTQRDPAKILNNANKPNQSLAKEKSPLNENFKSPKKNPKRHLSPQSKKLQSPKSHKFQKQNIETKQFSTNQRLETKKSPNQKTLIKNQINQLDNLQSIKKPNINAFSHPSCRSNQLEKGLQIKRNIRTIPLKVEEYILIEDNFEKIKRKSLYKFETKLLSTYRNNYKQFQSKILLKENLEDSQLFFQKIYRPCFQQINPNFIERSSANCLASQNVKDVEKQYRNSPVEDEQTDANIIQKVVLIQRWWRSLHKIEYIKNYLIKSFRSNQKAQTEQYSAVKKQKHFTNPVNLPSTISLQLNDQVCQDEKSKENEQILMLKSQNKIVHQKRTMHERILKNLLKQNKISKDQYDAKIFQVQKYYERQLKEIMSLYKIIEFGRHSTYFDQIQAKCSDVKIIQGQNHNVKSKESVESSPQKLTNYKKPQNQTQDEDDQLKIYKIGDKVTSEMQSYIQTTKRHRECSEKLETQNQEQNKFALVNYDKKTYQLGQEYYEDFESESSNQASPHKLLQASSFEDFEAEITAQNQGKSFEPNSHFIKMLEQYKQQQMVKEKIEKRMAIQMGACKAQNQLKYSVDTSLMSIHQFLVNFFKFYLHYYKDEFLRFINMPYGYQLQKRLKFIQGFEDESEDLSQDSDGIIYGLEYIISDDVFDEFVNQYYAVSFQTGNQHQKVIIQCAKIHDRALFECFNEALNNFRPYYSIGGPPYIWNCSEKTLTFYFIAEENINEVFEKTEYRVMKWASALLGLHVDGFDFKTDKKFDFQEQSGQSKEMEQIMQKNQTNCHACVIEKRQQSLIKQERIEIIDSMNKWSDYEQQRTSALFQLSSVVLEHLMQELALEFLLKESSNQVFQEFY